MTPTLAEADGLAELEPRSTALIAKLIGAGVVRVRLFCAAHPRVAVIAAFPLVQPRVPRSVSSGVAV